MCSHKPTGLPDKDRPVKLQHFRTSVTLCLTNLDMWKRHYRRLYDSPLTDSDPAWHEDMNQTLRRIRQNNRLLKETVCYGCLLLYGYDRYMKECRRLHVRPLPEDWIKETYYVHLSP